jgi:hypothetical protein
MHIAARATQDKLFCLGCLCPGGMLAGTTGGYRDHVAHRGQKIKRRVSVPTLTAALPADRFATYLQWASGNQNLAERLYTYNVQLSAALYGPLHMQEISLRNMADQALAQRYGPAWYLIRRSWPIAINAIT